MADRGDGGDSGDVFTSMVARLSRQSVDKHFDAFADVDWESPEMAISPDDPRFGLWASDRWPPPMVSLPATGGSLPRGLAPGGRGNAHRVGVRERSSTRPARVRVLAPEQPPRVSLHPPRSKPRNRSTR